MRTKMQNWLFYGLLGLLALVLPGCEHTLDTPDTENSSIQQLTEDELTMDAASDDMWDDMNSFMDDRSLKNTALLPCNVKDSIRINGDTTEHILTYNGVNCQGTRTRSGQLTVRFRTGVNWGDAGAEIVVAMKNYRLARTGGGGTLTLNGTKTYKNLVGGRVKDVGNGVGQVIQQGRGTFTVTFDNNNIRTWSMSKQRVFTGSPGNLNVTNTGLGSSGGNNYLVFWGNTRSGTQFFTKIISAVIHKQVCSLLPCSGTRIHMLPGADNNTLIFGFNEKNQPVSGSECPTKAKLEWEATGYKGTIYIKL